MKRRRGAGTGPFAVAGILMLAGCARTPRVRPEPSAQAAPAIERAIAGEDEAIEGRAGLWDVTETVWESPRAAPVTTTGLVAERRMIGAMLQEVMHGRDDASPRRMDYLRFNRTEGRWDYVSMDMRAEVGIMPAWSAGRGDGTRIDLTFAPFALPGGVMLRMTQVIAIEGPDRDVKDQHFILADATGIAWLAHRYAYVRRRA